MVARDVSKVVEIGGELGFSLNVSKCELVSHDGFTVTAFFSLFQGHVLAMSHFLALQISLARRLIGPGQTDVLSFLGRLAD